MGLFVPFCLSLLPSVLAPPPGGNSPSCGDARCASYLGTVGTTTVSGTDANAAVTWQSGTTIAGPFEAGFDSQIDTLLTWLGCSPASKGYVDGGIDTYTATNLVIYQCGVTLPRTSSGVYINLLYSCGAHSPPSSGCTSPPGGLTGYSACSNPAYHFHQYFACLYSTSAAGHSTKIGISSATSVTARPLYGMYEATGVLPSLDACGGHFGFTPDSPSTSIYHHHVQDKPPFTFGCYGPNADGGLVTLAQCRSYNTACGVSSYIVTITTSAGSFQYNKWCPCWDSCGSNVPGNVCAGNTTAANTMTTTMAGSTISSTGGAGGGGGASTTTGASTGTRAPSSTVNSMTTNTPKTSGCWSSKGSFLQLVLVLSFLGFHS